MEPNIFFQLHHFVLTFHFGMTASLILKEILPRIIPILMDLRTRTHVSQMIILTVKNQRHVFQKPLYAMDLLIVNMQKMKVLTYVNQHFQMGQLLNV